MNCAQPQRGIALLLQPDAAAAAGGRRRDRPLEAAIFAALGVAEGRRVDQLPKLDGQVSGGAEARRDRDQDAAIGRLAGLDRDDSDGEGLAGVLEQSPRALLRKGSVRGKN